MSLQTYVDKIDDSDIPQPLKSTLAAFLDDFQEIIKTPKNFHPGYMTRMMEILAEEVLSEQPPEHLWWEVALYLAAIWAKGRDEVGQITLERIESLKPLLENRLPNNDANVTLKEITMETVFGKTVYL